MDNDFKELRRIQRRERLAIVRLKDKNGWSFSKIGKKFGISKQRAKQRYDYQKMRMEAE